MAQHLKFDTATLWTDGASPNVAFVTERDLNGRTHVIEELGDTSSNIYRGTKRDNRAYVVGAALLVPAGSAFTLKELKSWWELSHTPDGGLRVVERETALGTYYLDVVPSTPQWGDEQGSAMIEVTQEYVAPTPLWRGAETSAHAHFNGVAAVALNCTNAGNADTWPRFIINGPVTDPKITATDWELEFDLTMAAGDELAVICKTPASAWYTPSGGAATRAHGYRTSVKL